jgi:hypothetical protein
MLLASVFPLRFPLLNLCVRDRNNALCEPFETLERRFGFWGLRMFHVAAVLFHDLERNAYRIGSLQIVQKRQVSERMKC